MQGTWIWSLVQEDPTCLKATKPRSHNYWALVLQLLEPVQLEPVLCNESRHHNEKPMRCNKGPAQPQINTKKWVWLFYSFFSSVCRDLGSPRKWRALKMEGVWVPEDHVEESWPLTRNTSFGQLYEWKMNFCVNLMKFGGLFLETLEEQHCLW